MSLLEVNNLKMHFPVRGGVSMKQVAAVKAVDGVSFAVKPGETLGLVGESGAGLVKATASAKGDLKALDIDPSIFNGDEKEVVEDLILAAIKDAQAKAAAKAEQEMAKLTDGLGLPADMKLIS